MKKKFLMVIFGFLLCISLVSAYRSYDLVGFYERYYQVIDFFIYFTFFTLIVKLTVGKRFSKEGDERSANLLSVVFGLVVALGIVLFETNKYYGPLFLQQDYFIVLIVFCAIVLWMLLHMGLTGLGMNSVVAGILISLIYVIVWFSRDIFFKGSRVNTTYFLAKLFHPLTILVIVVVFLLLFAFGRGKKKHGTVFYGPIGGFRP